MNNDRTIVFVCEHGAAKSIIAAAYFNKFALEQSIPLQAIARGTTPDETLSPKTVTGLKEDGLQPTEIVPQKLSSADLESARKIVSFCDLSGEPFDIPVEVEQWQGVPPVSENYQTARDAIVERLKILMNDLDL
jgi:arsenate reductase (thioredoxin)